MMGFGKLYGAITTIITFLVVVVGGAAAWEVHKPATEYFTHYGNITVKDAFVAPDTISVYSFGHIPIETKELTAAHRLYCVSADSMSRQWVLIGTQYGSITAANDLNMLPDSITAYPVGEGDSTDLGVSSRKMFTTLLDDGNSLFRWELVDMVPSDTSSCYIQSTVTARSEIFDMKKSITFKSIEFSYLYPTEK